MHLFCWTEAKGKVVKLIIEPRHIFYPNDPFIHFVFWNKERHHYYDYEKEHELFWKKNRNSAAVSSSFVVKSFNIFDVQKKNSRHLHSGNVQIVANSI